MTGSDAGTAVERASVWLRAYLSDQGGQGAAGDVLAAAAAAGHRGRTCQRARAELGVTVARSGFGRGGTWALPAVHSRQPLPPTPSQDAADAPTEAKPLATPRTPAPLRVPGRPDALGRTTEFVQVNSAEAASHWDERGWRSVD